MKRDLRWKLRDPNAECKHYTCYDYSVPGKPLPIGFYSHNLQYGFCVWGIASDLDEKLNITVRGCVASNETAAKIAVEDTYYGGLKWLEAKLEEIHGPAPEATESLKLPVN